MRAPRWVRNALELIVRKPLLSLFWLVFATCVTLLHAVLVARELVELRTAIVVFLALGFVILLLRELVRDRSDTRLKDFMQKLYEATEERTCRYSEHIQHTYVIENDGRDHTIRRWDITPREHALVWRKARFGVRGAATELQRLEDLHLNCSADQGEVWCIPVDESDPNHIEAVLFFVPPIVYGSTRQVSIDHVWPGTWNPLRTTGRDTGELEVAHDEAESLVLEFIFPRGYKNPRFTSRNPLVGTTETFETPQKRIGLRWSIQAPTRGQFTYVIEVDR